MMSRPPRETLESLRVTLQKLEQTTDPESDKDVTELKQILLNRIAELETLEALQPEAADTSTPAPTDLPPIASATESETPKEPAAPVLGKMN